MREITEFFGTIRTDAEGIIIDYDKKDNIVGVEILNFTEKNLNLNDLAQMTIEELIPILTEWE